jgi:hypothetical protein
MRLRPNALLAIGLGTVLAGSAAATPIVIDDFSNDQSITVSGGNGPLQSAGGVSASGAIGGARFMRLSRVSGYGTDTLTANGGGMGLLDLSSAAADSASARLTYDGGTDNVLTPTGLGGVDLTSSGSNSVIQVLARSDLVAPLTITVYTDGSNFSTAVVNLPGQGFGATPFSVIDIPFSSFLADSGTGADFHNVGAISVGIFGASVPSLDAQLDSIIATVPEPGTLLLLVAGLGGLALTGRRRSLH